MAREKRDFKNEVDEGVQEHEYRKNIRRKNSGTFSKYTSCSYRHDE